MAHNVLKRSIHVAQNILENLIQVRLGSAYSYLRYLEQFTVHSYGVGSQLLALPGSVDSSQLPGSVHLRYLDQFTVHGYVDQFTIHSSQLLASVDSSQVLESVHSYLCYSDQFTVHSYLGQFTTKQIPRKNVNTAEGDKVMMSNRRYYGNQQLDGKEAHRIALWKPTATMHWPVHHREAVAPWPTTEDRGANCNLFEQMWH